MSTRGSKTLSAEDRILWHRVARSVKPLGKAKSAELAQSDEAGPEIARPQKSSTGKPVPGAPEKPRQKPHEKPRPSGIDLKTHGKIAKGRLSIDARIDLHGMTQAEAHGVLLSFLHRAHASGLRHVMVITGKGKAGDGILRKAVPAWLATAPFRGLVSAHAAAARPHGGEGALYIRLRRRDKRGE